MISIELDSKLVCFINIQLIFEKKPNYKKIMGNPTFTKTIKVTEDGVEKTRVVLNKRGEEAAKAAGLDTTKMNEKFIKDFTEKL